jgi:serine/threonine-protein kinase 24/25/MST4
LKLNLLKLSLRLQVILLCSYSFPLFFFQAKLALEAGFRRGNARERLGNGKVNKRREQATDNSDYLRNSRDHSDKQRPVMRSQQVSDDEEDDSKLASLSASLSLLLLPSLKEVSYKLRSHLPSYFSQ